MRFLQFSTNHHRLYLFWTLAIVGLVMPWGCEWTRDVALFTATSECTVDGIHDGDTMRLTCSGEQVKVRLYCIDAPELAQKLLGP